MLDELLAEAGMTRMDPHFRGDERQTYAMDPFPPLREVQQRMSSARQFGMREGFLRGAGDPHAVFAEIRRNNEAVRGPGPGQARRAEGEPGPAEGPSPGARGRAGAPDVRRDMALMEAQLEEEARELRGRYNRRGAFEAEMNDIRVRTTMRVEHRHRVLAYRPGQGVRAGPPRRARQAGVLERLDALARVVDAVESGRPAEMVNVTNRETEMISNRARMAIQQTRVLLSVNQQEQVRGAGPALVPPGPAGAGAPGRRAEPEGERERRRAERLVRDVRRNLGVIRDAVEQELLARFADVVELEDPDAPATPPRRRPPPPLPANYGANGAELLSALGLPTDGPGGAPASPRPPPPARPPARASPP